MKNKLYFKNYYFESLLEKNRDDYLVVYKKDSYYPCVKIDVVTVEKSRDEMGLLEITILKLINNNIDNINNLAKLTGFSKVEKLRTVIEELQGFGLITRRGDALSVSEIGKMSIENGHQMIETSASLLLCGITGKLLPKGMYNAKRVEAKDLSSAIGFKYLIDEKAQLPLKSLSLENIDKRKYNIKDEVQYIARFDEYTQVFLQADVSIFQDNNKLYTEIRVNNKEVDWDIDNHNLINEVKFETKNLMQNAENIQKDFLLQGFTNVEIKPLEFNSITINFEEASLELLKKKFNSHPILAYIGMGNKYLEMPVAINRLPFKTDNRKLLQELNGPTLFLTTSSLSISNLAIIYRAIENIKFIYFYLPRSNEKLVFFDYLKKEINALPYKKSDVHYVIKHFSTEKIKTLILEKDSIDA